MKANMNTGSNDPVSLETAERMLSYVRGVDDRAVWVKMAYIMRDEFGEPGFDAWNDWSRASDTYKESDAKAVWKSAHGGTGKKATIGTLIALALEGGWKPSEADRREVSPEERAQRAKERAQRLEEERKQAEAAAKKAADDAAKIWQESASEGEHPYLKRKQIKLIGARIHGETLIVPMKHSAKELVGVQRISPDGEKKYIYGVAKKGAYCTLGKPTSEGPIVICEGYATGCSIHMATGHCVVVAFDAGNLFFVAGKIRAALPKASMIVAADDDFKTLGNPGVTKATEAARHIGAMLAVPMWTVDRGEGTDFNDLHCAEGLTAVADCIHYADFPKPVSVAAPEPAPEVVVPVVVAEPARIPEPGPAPAALAPAPITEATLIPVDSSEVAPDCSDDDLATRHLQRMQSNTLWCEMWGRWLVWNGDRWLRDETNIVLDAVRNSCKIAANLVPSNKAAQAQKIASAKTISSVERLARVYREVATHPEEWDADRWLLNTPGGVVDLRTGQTRPHSREDRFTKITAVTPGGECPTWLDFLRRATGGDEELIGFLRRMCGYSLTGEVREHALFFVYGTGGNGKGTFLNTITHIMGDYQRVSSAETFTESNNDRHTTELARLHGARLVTAQETEEGKRWAESRIKALTGGDPITARYMRQDDFTFLPQFKLVIVGNHKPSFRSVDDAIRRRLHLIPFTASIPAEEKDPELPEKLRAEAGGILKWMIEGCLEWAQSGLKPPAIVKDSTDKYLGSEDSLQQWLDDCCDIERAGFTTSKALFYSWSKWCEQSGEYVGTMKRLMAKLESRGISTGQKFKGARGCIGIKIKSDEVHDFGEDF